MPTLLGINPLSAQVLLDVPEQLFNRVQPRRVLSVEHHIHSHPSSCLQDFGVLMYDRIVHEQDYGLVLKLSVASHTSESMVYEVLKQH